RIGRGGQRGRIRSGHRADGVGCCTASRGDEGRIIGDTVATHHGLVVASGNQGLLQSAAAAGGNTTKVDDVRIESSNSRSQGRQIADLSRGDGCAAADRLAAVAGKGTGKVVRDAYTIRGVVVGHEGGLGVDRGGESHFSIYRTLLDVIATDPEISIRQAG